MTSLTNLLTDFGICAVMGAFTVALGFSLAVIAEWLFPKRTKI